MALLTSLTMSRRRSMLLPFANRSVAPTIAVTTGPSRLTIRRSTPLGCQRVTVWTRRKSCTRKTARSRRNPKHRRCIRGRTETLRLANSAPESTTGPVIRASETEPETQSRTLSAMVSKDCLRALQRQSTLKGRKSRSRRR